MAIDDLPHDALVAQFENEERARAPIQKYVDEIAELIPGPIGSMLNWSVRRDRAAKQQLMTDVLKSEIRQHEDTIQNLYSKSLAHETFLKEDWIPLLIDGLKKSEQARSKSRAATIGLILSNSLRLDPPADADFVEEMMRIATILDNKDIEVLRQIVAQQGSRLPPSGALDENQANQAWHANPPSVPGVSDAMLTSICSKLESLGLIRAVKPHIVWYSLQTVGTPFTLLDEGRDFVAFAIRQVSDSGPSES